MSGSRKVSGNPCNRAHSLEVSFLIPSLSLIIGTLCSPIPMLAVNAGHPLFFYPDPEQVKPVDCN